MEQPTKKRQRTCIGCGKQGQKGSLLRVVREPDGTIRFDETGRAAGRGAYVCSTACFDTAWNARRLDRALKKRLTENDRVRISAELAAYTEASAS